MQYKKHKDNPAMPSKKSELLECYKLLSSRQSPAYSPHSSDDEAELAAIRSKVQNLTDAFPLAGIQNEWEK